MFIPERKLWRRRFKIRLLNKNTTKLMYVFDLIKDKDADLVVARASILDDE